MPTGTKGQRSATRFAFACTGVALTSCAFLGSAGHLAPAVSAGSGSPAPADSGFTWIHLSSPSPTPAPLPLTLYGLTVGNQLWVQVSWPQGGTGSITVMELGQDVPQGVHASGWIDALSYSPAITFQVRDASGSLYQATLGPVAPPSCTGVAAGGGGGGGSSGPTSGCPWVQSSPGITPYDYFKLGQTPPTESTPILLSWTDSSQADGYLVDFGTATPNNAPPPPLTFSGKPVAFTASQSLTVGATDSLPGLTDQAPYQALLASASLSLDAWPTLIAGPIYGWSVQPVVFSPDRHSVAVGPQTTFPYVFEAP